MEIAFAKKKLSRDLSDQRRLQRAHGDRRARLIMRRLSALQAADTLADFWPPNSGPERCHELSGNREGQLSVDLDHPYRLVFTVANDPVPRKEDGGLDWRRVTQIRILAVEDTHD